jgi:two-component system CheB/CheR fusion protein
MSPRDWHNYVRQVTDGTPGLEAIKAKGGITFAQADLAPFDSMPRSAVAAGCVDFGFSPENIAKELQRTLPKN